MLKFLYIHVLYTIVEFGENNLQKCNKRLIQHCLQIEKQNNLSEFYVIKLPIHYQSTLMILTKSLKGGNRMGWENVRHIKS